MELGLALDDDSLFEFSREGRTLFTHRNDEYTVKHCHPLWFNEIDLTAGVDADKILKYQGDLAYRNGLYAEALDLYQQCQAKLTSNNTSTWRGVVEDQARCLLRLARYRDASNCASYVVESAQNVEQVTSALRLLSDVSRAAGNAHNESVNVRKLLLMHPHSPRLWIRLGDLFNECHLHTADQHMTLVDTLNKDTTDTCNGSMTLLQPDARLAFISYSAALLTIRVKSSTSLCKEANSALHDQVSKKISELKVSPALSDECSSFLRSALTVDEDDKESTAAGCYTVQLALQILREKDEVILDLFNKKYVSYALS